MLSAGGRGDWSRLSLRSIWLTRMGQRVPVGTALSAWGQAAPRTDPGLWRVHRYGESLRLSQRISLENFGNLSKFAPHKGLPLTIPTIIAVGRNLYRRTWTPA
jgi:hypothetical protein